MANKADRKVDRNAEMDRSADRLTDLEQEKVDRRKEIHERKKPKKEDTSNGRS